MLLKGVIVIAILVAGVLLFAATKPGSFRIQRSMSIQAPPEKVFALINDFHNWKLWAPQDREDPTMRRTFFGVESGVGAVSTWKGSGSTGEGRMVLTESAPPSKVVVEVDFVKPFEAHNVNEFVIELAGATTRVTWKMHGPNLYVMKVMSVFVSMDRVMGEHFEKGLANLKAVAEGS